MPEAKLTRHIRWHCTRQLALNSTCNSLIGVGELNLCINGSLVTVTNDTIPIQYFIHVSDTFCCIFY